MARPLSPIAFAILDAMAATPGATITARALWAVADEAHPTDEGNGQEVGDMIDAGLIVRSEAPVTYRLTPHGAARLAGIE